MRLERQIRFLNEADKLKSIDRGTTLCDGSRPENSAEHSWHLTLYALVLADQAGPGVQIDRVIKMLILHDLVEIDAGDNPIFGQVDQAGMEAAEQAAADLYATPFQVFKRVTLPQLWPGILAGAMLAFVISLDDVVITEFVKSAGQDTLPTYMLGQLRRVVTPEINAISTVLLAISVTMVIAFTLLSKLKN